MENFRSMSCRDGKKQMDQSYTSGGGGGFGPNSMHDLRSYSTSHASTSPVPPREVKIIKKSKSTSVGSTTSKIWTSMTSDPELQRKKRVASYKVYAVEGKMKGSIRKSFKWVKDTCTHVVYGWH